MTKYEEFINNESVQNVLRRLRLQNEDFDWDDYWDYTFVPMAKVILSIIGIAVLAGAAICAIIVLLKLAFLVVCT